MSDTKWFVVHTYSGYENKVAANIEKMVENRGMQDQILEVKIPTVTETVIKNDVKEEREVKLYPSYVFVKVAVAYKKVANSDIEELAMTDDAWFVIRNTRGVTGFVGPESKATPLSDAEVEKFGIEDSSSKSRTATVFNVGDKVEITDERFKGMTGTVSKIDLENEIVVLSTELFGKETTVELNIYDIKLIEED